MQEIIYYLPIIISVIGLIIATYTDLKARIVPNTLNYGLAIIGVLLFGVISIIEWNSMPIVLSILGLCYGFFFGWIMWKIGVFAGGDVKLFMGLGALNPFTPALLKAGLLTNASVPLFPITLFLYSLVCFLPYGIFVMIYRVSKNKKFQKELYYEMKPKVILAIETAIFASAVYVILDFIKFNTWAVIPIIIVWGFLGKKKVYPMIIALLAAAVLGPKLLLTSLAAAMILSVGAYTLVKLMLTTRKVLTTEIEVKKLEEGMIPAKSLAWKGKKIIELEGIDYKLIIKYIKEGNTNAIKKMFSPKDELISARKARGLSDDELKEVKKLAAKGLIPKKMLIKESMPFVPTMLLGYLLCLIAGDLALLMLIGVF